MISEGSRDTEDWRNDAENLPSQKIDYILEQKTVHSITVFE